MPTNATTMSHSHLGAGQIGADPTKVFAPPSTVPSKSMRALACVLCAQRKLKCDRNTPCANCVKSRTQCLASTPRPLGRRKRKFPEQQLLERLRKYEDLLRKNNIAFEALPSVPSASKQSKNAGSDNDGEGADVSSPSTTVKSEDAPEAK